MKTLILAFLATLVTQTFAAELKDVFPLTCGLERADRPDRIFKPRTFRDLDELETVNAAPYFWSIDKSNDAKYVFGYLNGQFRAQYRRQESHQEKIARANSQAEQFKGGVDETIHVLDVETVYASIEDLAKGEEFTYTSEETPNFTLICQKGLIQDVDQQDQDQRDNDEE